MIYLVINNIIVFFSIQGMSKHSSTHVWAKLNGKKIRFRNSEVCRNIRHWPKLLYLNSINFTPIQSWISESFDYLAKTMLALGACSQFQNLKGSVLHLCDAFGKQEWITEWGTSSACWCVQTPPSPIFFGLVSGIGQEDSLFRRW